MVHEVFATVPGAAGSGYRDSQFPPPTHHYNKVEVTRSHLHPSYVPKNAIHQSNSLLIGWQGLCHNPCKLPVPTQAKSDRNYFYTELAPDHIICKSRGIIYRGHTFVETWTFPFDFSAVGQLTTDFSHYKRSLTKYLFRIKIQKWRTDKCISHYVPLSH